MVLTSTLPRWVRDTEPAFVLELCERLAADFSVLALAPHAAGAAPAERIGSVAIKRFRYFWERGEVLAYDGGIPAKLRRRPLAWALVPLFILAQILAAVRLLRSRRVAVIHAHWLLPQGLCAWIAKVLARSPAPIVCTVHGADVFALNSAAARALQRFVAHRCAAVAAVSPTLRDALVARGVSAERIRVLPMGVPVSAAAPPEPGAPGPVVFVGRLVAKKGVDVLLRAVARLTGPDAPGLIVAGGGPERDALEALAHRLGIASRVTFAGPLPHDEVLALLRRATVTVVPSVVAAGGDTEGLGLVALEAMAEGCPVIGSDLPALRGFISDREHALLFRAGDDVALAAALRELLASPALRRSLVACAGAMVRERFSWDHSAAGYRALFRELVAQRT